MESSTVSSKYQVVIPKKLRKQLQLKPGQKVSLTTDGKDKIVIDTRSNAAKIYGSMKGAWGPDSDKYLQELRDEWEKHQQDLDEVRG